MSSRHSFQTDQDTPNHFEQLWLSEALRLHEQHNPPLEDSEACRHARQQGDTLIQRLTQRNLWLARREGLIDSLSAWLGAARLSGFVLVVLALLSGWALGQTALSRQHDSINIIWALTGLLGPNLLTLLLWLAGLLLGSRRPSQGTRLLLNASEWLSRSPRAGQLSAALFSLLGRARLLPWALGRFIHGWWLLTLLSTLACCLFLLATHRYAFAWETTIVQADAFVRLIQWLGQPVQWLGLPLPDDSLIRSSGEALLNDEHARQTWAGWLMGLLIVYGILPRLLLAAFCQWRWRQGRRRLALDLEDPVWQPLHARLIPEEQRRQIIDPAPALTPVPEAHQNNQHCPFTALATLELEQPPQWTTPPPAELQWLGNLDGYADQQAVLEQLAANPGQALILACDSRRSPDRGSLYFMGELARSTSRLHIWLLHADQDPQRLAGWQRSLDALGIAHGDYPPWQPPTETYHA